MLVGNPTAQSGRNAARIEKARTMIEARGARCEPFPTLPRGETVAALRQRLDKGNADMVVSMGGDGTFREVGAALLDSTARASIAMGMLPTGTANDQGKSFGLHAAASDLEHNVDVLFARHETQLDAGRIVSKDAGGAVLARSTFFDSAGWGLSARVLRVRNEDRAVVEELGPIKELYRDFAVYGGAFVKTFLSGYVEDHKFDVVAIADGNTHILRGLTDLIVKATRVYAGAWVFDETARHDDGQFEIVPFVGRRDWASKALLHIEGNPITEQMLNAVGVSHSGIVRAQSMTLSLQSHDESPVPAQIDGEEFTPAASVEIDVVPRALRLIVPKPA